MSRSQVLCGPRPEKSAKRAEMTHLQLALDGACFVAPCSSCRGANAPDPADAAVATDTDAAADAADAANATDAIDVADTAGAGSVVNGAGGGRHRASPKDAASSAAAVTTATTAADSRPPPPQHAATLPRPQGPVGGRMDDTTEYTMDGTPPRPRRALIPPVALHVSADKAEATPPLL